MSLRVDDPAELCLRLGERVHVTLAMSCLEVAVCGYQAFLEFDAALLTFVEGSYVLPEPFGRPLTYPIVAEGNHIDLAAGIDSGQEPATEDADLVHLTFEAAATEGVTRIRFRENVPPTLLVTAEGAVFPALLDSTIVRVNAGCPCLVGDADCDGDVDADDCAEFVGCLSGPWRATDFITPSLECLDAFDFDTDRDVDLQDFGWFQRVFTGQ